jgi:hypothetical protein
MTALTVAGAVAAGLLGLFCLLSAVLLVGAAVGTRAYRRQPLIKAGRAALVEVAALGRPAVGTDLPGPAAALAKLRRGELTELFSEVAPAVGGDALRALRATAEAAGLLDRAYVDLGSRHWGRRLVAARFLTAVGASLPADQLGLFHDRHAMLRAQAATLSIGDPTAATVDALVELLADHDGRCRFAARDALVRLGATAVPALVGALDAADPLVVAGALEVAAAAGDPAYAGPAERIAGAGPPGHRAVAMAVLGTAGDPASTATLFAGLDDPEPSVRAAAVAAIAERGDWSAVGALARKLSDRAWPVRRAAAVALLRLGAPGLVLLRDAARTGDPAAAEVAELALRRHRLTAAPAAGTPDRGTAEVARAGR